MSSKPSIVADPDAAAKQARRMLAADPEAAVRQARQLLRARPDDPALLRVLGAGLRRLGQPAEAEQAERQAVEASTRSPIHRQAARAVALGDRPGAEALLKSLVARDEQDVVALVMLGTLWSEAGKLDAEPLLRRAVAAAPADPAARFALADFFHRFKRSAEAIEQLDAMPAERRDSPDVLSLRAASLSGLGRHEEEIELLEELLRLEPGRPRYLLRLGHALRTLGRGEEAANAYREIIKTTPGEGGAWWSLANLKSARFSDADMTAMRAALDVPGGDPQNRIRLHFALGKAHEDRKQADEAFHHYAEGNRLRAELSTYRPEAITARVDRAIALYTPQFFEQRSSGGCAAPDPIFVVGMQRSGSTLVEQILASHPQIEGTAELVDLQNISRELGERAVRRGQHPDQLIAALSPDERRALGESYLQRAGKHRLTDRPLFVDKMPNNWLHVGLIRLILPAAKIVDVRRHPLACGFSNWKQLYAKGLEHSYSLAAMGRHYAEYVRLMRHFDAARPGLVHRVIYERLVEDTEAEVRRLFDYLGVDFDPAVLDFHTTDRAVRTISAEQVRQPINRQGLDQWRPFEQWLGPLEDALGDTLEDWQQ